MPEAARLNDNVTGTTAGEHSGHAAPHSPETFGGHISSGCSGDVFINGRPAAVVGSNTDVTGNPFSVTFANLDGVVAEGVHNTAQARMEF